MQSGCSSCNGVKNGGTGLEKSLENRDHQWHNGTVLNEIGMAPRMIGFL